MISNTFRMDEIDQKIVQLIQKEPHLTHTKIASKINRSQPTVGLRIKKLEEAGVLNFHAGMSIREVDIHFAMIKISTNNPANIMKMVKQCPHIINAFRLSGEFNIVVLLASFKLENIDKIINSHFRSNPEISKIEMDIVSDVAEDYMIPLNLIYEDCSCPIY